MNFAMLIENYAFMYTMSIIIRGNNRASKHA